MKSNLKKNKKVIIDSTVKQSHIPSEDDLLHFTIMVKENGDRKRCLEMFGVVFKVCRLRREDDRIINVVKGIIFIKYKIVFFFH